ncbi:hypothetical protein SUGI_0931610 [Cryptomeria japonica]|nr:hypothetical protein SUGI_0931610 [Cryptomeria japonica]
MASTFFPSGKEGSIEEMLNCILENEFFDKDQSQGAHVSNVADQSTVLQSVAGSQLELKNPHINVMYLVL